MSDYLYDKARQSFISQNPSIDLDSDSIKFLFASVGYVASQSADQYVEDVGSGNIVARSGALAGKTVTSGVFDATDKTVTSVSGAAITQIVFYKDTGDDSTSPLIAHVSTYTGLPLTPNGGDVPVQFPNDANRIFKI